jgi:hypothetical protein
MLRKTSSYYIVFDTETNVSCDVQWRSVTFRDVPWRSVAFSGVPWRSATIHAVVRATPHGFLLMLHRNFWMLHEIFFMLHEIFFTLHEIFFYATLNSLDATWFSA